MNLLIVTPAPSGSRVGNRITADRWAKLLRGLGHRVEVATEYRAGHHDVLIALHARKSHPAIVRHVAEAPGKPLLLALTGTDLYDDIHSSDEARQSLELATRLIVLQPLAAEELPEHLRSRVRVIYQSVDAPRLRQAPDPQIFEICVMGHLRPVKDPLRTALAARLLPASSRIVVTHLGGALSEEMKEAVEQEERVNPRYRWLGEQKRSRALRILSRCRLLVLSSKLEGGANVIGEAVTLGVPVLSSRIAGSAGLLGDDYPGFFPYGDTQALAGLLQRAETDEAFYCALKEHCELVRPLFEPERERAAWRVLLAEVSGLA